MRREFLVVILSALSLTICGCTGLTSGQSGDQSGAVAEQDTREEENPLRSELDDYLGVGDYSKEKMMEADEASYQLDVKREELVVACMAEHGFEYKSTAHWQKPSEMEVDDRTEMERAEQDGFGVFPMDRDATPDPELMDPNSPMIDAMSESELEAWSRALHGDLFDAEIDDLNPEDIEAQQAAGHEPGCLERAAKALEDEYAEWDKEYMVLQTTLYSGQWDDLAESITALADVYDDSPEVHELKAAWSSCMEQKGYQYKDKWEIFEYLFDKRDEVYGLDALSGPGGRLPEDVEIPAPDPQLEAAAVKEERELAVANETCREQVDYGAEYDRIRVAYENKFVEDHRELLEQFKAASSGTK